MGPTACPTAPDFAGRLYAALALTERISSLRQAEASWVGSRSDTGRAAAAIAQWKSQEPFPVGDHFEKRLRLDSLTEENLLAILGLPPEVYSELLPNPPEWLRDLQRLYSSESPPVSPVPDDEVFLQWARQGTNPLLWIAYPLIQEGLRRFREEVRRLPAEGAPFEPATVERLALPNLFETLKLAVESMMVLELNVARVRGLLRGDQPEERFRSFCESLRQPEVRWSLVQEYPVLFRSLHIRMMNWVDYHLELLGRLSKDWDLICDNLALGMEQVSLTAISAGAGDEHRQGRTVAILEFSSGLKVVYKPHSLSLDVHFGEFLEWVNQSGFEPQFRTLKVLDRGSYGWSEFVSHQPCSSLDEVERFYQRLGGYLAVFHSFKATDMHYENLIAAGEFPVPVDLETIFHPDVEDEIDPGAGAWQLSVLRVMLLPARSLGSDTQEGIDVSGLGAKSGGYYPAGIAVSWEGAGTDEMRLVHDKPVPMNVVRNRPMLDEQDVVLEDYLEDFLMGFERVYRLMEARCEELRAPGGMLDRFGEDEVRFIARPTITYSTLLVKALHPDNLRNAIDRDQLFDFLWLFPSDLPHFARLVPAELKDLHGGDVPLFIARPNSRDLWTSRGERIPQVFRQTAIEAVRKGLRQLGEEDLALQTRFIRAAISSTGGEVVRARTTAKQQLSDSRDAMDLARAVGDTLCREAVECESYASWLGLTPVGSREMTWSLQPLEGGFYSGLSGCSFFLAYLGVLTGNQSYSRFARKAINLVRRQLERRRAGGLPLRSLEAYSGSGGMIYTLTHLGVLWQDSSLIDEAKVVAADLPSLIETDRMLDVLGGCAAWIAALAVLNSISPSNQLLDTAVLCGERVLLLQQPQSSGGGWKTEIDASQPLTGFSHGAAGIAWALLKLAAWSGEARFREAAESAIGYERSTFVAEEGNWPDYRSWEGKDESKLQFMVAWCHGAAGIGLARMDNLQYMDDSETREEIGIALSKTIKSNFGRNHCLCHGDLGKLDVLLYAAQRIDDSWWRDAGKRLTSETLAGIAERGPLCGAQSSLASPGFMTGLAGIGYGLLRLACPERVPSVLVLAPPAQA